MNNEWLCSRCQADLGKFDQHGLFLNFKNFQYSIESPTYKIITVCWCCSMLNILSVPEIHKQAPQKLSRK